MDQQLFGQFEKINDKLTEIVVDLSSVKTSLDSIQDELRSNTQTLLEHETRLTKAEGTLTSTSKTAAETAIQVDGHDGRLSSLEAALRIAVWLIALLGAVAVGVTIKMLTG